VRRIAATAAAILVAAAASAADLDAGAAALIARIQGETPTLSDLRELTDRIGGRLTGTPACDKAVDWAAAKFRAAGVSVTTEPFTMPLVWLPQSIEAACVAPAAFPLRVAAVPGTSGTPKGKAIEAPVVDAGDGGEAAWAALGTKARGAIALVRTNEMKTFEDLFAEYLTAPAILRAARAAGASAVIVQSSRPRGLLYRHPMTFNADVDPMPVALIAREQADRLLRLVEKEPVRVRLAIDNAVEPNRPMRNVVAEIKGSAKPEEIVVVGAHLDSFDLGTGANDNGVSCAEVIDLARQIKASGLTPRRTIRFILFTGEEQGMIGSRAYVKAHDKEMDRHAAAVIYDIGSGKLTGWFLNGREDLRAAADAASARLASAGPFTHVMDGIDGTDSFDFLLAGIPNYVGFQDPAPYLPDYHAESDTFDKVDAKETKAAEAALASLVWELANAPTRSPRQTRQEVEALLKATKVDEQMKVWSQWDDWAAGKRGLPVSPASRP
jgi:hypothetical protein